MNKQRRKQIDELLEQIDTLKDGIPSVLDDEQEYRDGIPESMTEKQDSALNSLDEAADYLQSARDGD